MTIMVITPTSDDALTERGHGMRVLAIMGSPRRNGTGTKVVRQIEEELRKQGDVEMTYLYLADVDLKMCRGCFECISKGEDRCPLKDDRVGIEGMMDRSDGIILVSPGYVQNVSGLMKNFMDRFAYTNHRPRFFGKQMMLVANGGAGLDKTLDALRIAIFGPHIVSELAYAKLPWPTSPKGDVKQEVKLRKAAEQFYRAMVEKDMRPSFSDYMRFRFFKSVAGSIGEWMPADLAYYSALDQYYYDVRIGVGMKLKAAVVMRIGSLFMGSMAPYAGDSKAMSGPATDAGDGANNQDEPSFKGP